MDPLGTCRASLGIRAAHCGNRSRTSNSVFAKSILSTMYHQAFQEMQDIEIVVKT